jgi:flagellar M-ring protein FliF
MDLAQMLARLRATSAALTTPQIVSIALAFLLVVGGVIGGSYLSTPNYRLLFSDMDPTAAAAVMDRLKAQKIPYQIDDGGRAIRVPEDKVDELRLSLTAQGLPSTGRIGFEIFDRTAFGETEFLEHVNYRRALEGEIGRTIATIGEVASARVHIAMAKESLFESKEQPAKASVILKLKGRQPLPGATVAGIASLVASSVEGLRPESVVILDNFGRSLTRPAEADENISSGPLGVERQQRMEHELSTRVVSLLEPIVGPGRVRVNVAARLNAEAREETEEHFDPETVIRSHQTSSDTQQVGAGSVGLAGARSNVAPPAPPTAKPVSNKTDATDPAAPPPAPPAGPATFAPPAISRVSETTNYEISKVVRHSNVPRGELARLWVAVLVDDDVQLKPGKDGSAERTQKPRSAADLQKIQGLVAAAVGLDEDRGDQLTVENIAFDVPAAEIGTNAAPLPGMPAPRLLWIGIAAGGAVIGLILLVVVVRATSGPKRTAVRGSAKVADLPQSGALPRTVQDLQQEVEAQLNAEVANATGAQKLPALARRVGALASKEPEAVALLVRSWMAEDRR